MPVPPLCRKVCLCFKEQRTKRREIRNHTPYNAIPKNTRKGVRRKETRDNTSEEVKDGGGEGLKDRGTGGAVHGKRE